MMSIKISKYTRIYIWSGDVWTIHRRDGGIHPASVPDRAAPRRDEQPLGPMFALRRDFGSGSSEASRFTVRVDSSFSMID